VNIYTLLKKPANLEPEALFVSETQGRKIKKLRTWFRLYMNIYLNFHEKRAVVMIILSAFVDIFLNFQDNFAAFSEHFPEYSRPH
jgi:hypothetical protein